MHNATNKRQEDRKWRNTLPGFFCWNLIINILLSPRWLRTTKVISADTSWTRDNRKKGRLAKRGKVTRKAQQSCWEQPATPSSGSVTPQEELIQHDNKEKLNPAERRQREDTWQKQRHPATDTSVSPSVRTAERKTTGDTPSLQGPCQHNMDIMLNSGTNFCLHVSVWPGWKKQEGAEGWPKHQVW